MTIVKATNKLVVVGAGPAGIAAAVSAAECGRQVVLIDDNVTEGGQIWRGGQAKAKTPQAAEWFEKLKSSHVEILTGASIVAADAKARTLLAEMSDCAQTIEFSDLIVATGARELFLPFPGWTLPNVMGCGGLQGLVKSGLPVAGKRIVVAGSGPLLLAVASQLRKHCAVVSVIVEQADFRSLSKFAVGLASHPQKLWQALELRASLGSTAYLTSSWIEAAEGSDQLSRVRIHTSSRTRTVECDYLAIAYGFTPNTELAQLLGCNLKGGFVVADDYQRASLDGIYCAGELTGLGGVDLSLVEGEIAGSAAAGRSDLAQKLFPKRRSVLKFADALNRAFSLRAELRQLADAQTIVCRCEDVRYGKLQHANDWRSAKLHFRCGMGPCQGRICGPATQFLFGWKHESVRPPVFPARVSSLVSESNYVK